MPQKLSTHAFAAVLSCVLALGFSPISHAFAGDVLAPDPVEKVASAIPYAKDFEHTHNAPGWTCAEREGLICQIPEHSHDNSCYAASEAPTCGIEEGYSAHAHDDSCYATIGGIYFLLDEGETHITEMSDAADGIAAADASENRVLVCGKEESAGHAHDPADCFCALACDAQEHDHSPECYGQYVECSTESCLLTVEYVAKVGDQEVSVAEPYQSLLDDGQTYSVIIPDLSAEGYSYRSAVGFTRAEDGQDVPMQPAVAERDGNLYVEGEIASDTLIRVIYEQTEAEEPGSSAGDHDGLIPGPAGMPGDASSWPDFSEISDLFSSFDMSKWTIPFGMTVSFGGSGKGLAQAGDDLMSRAVGCAVVASVAFAGLLIALRMRRK